MRTAGAGGPSSGYAKGRERRVRIVEAAGEVYAEAGYHGASLREIAKRAGISHAGLLYYFPSREALLAAVLEKRDEADAGPATESGGGPMAAVNHLLALADHNARHPGIVELYVRLAAEAFAAEHPAHDYFVRHYALTRSYVERALVRLGQEGLLRDGVDPRTAAVNLVALMDGLQVQWLSTPEEVDMADSLKAFVHQLLKEPAA